MKVYIFSALTAFALSFFFCLILIPVLRKLKAGQNILHYVKEHSKKNGTPTMGGLAFIFAAVIASVVFVHQANRTVLVTLAVGLFYMSIGFFDDFLKKKHRENLGLKAWQKLFFQIGAALFAGIYCYRVGLTEWRIPFTGKYLSLGWWIIPLTAFVFVATVNAVNLTDGLDGLAAGASTPFFACMGIIVALETEDVNISVVCFTLTGALLAYLFFNCSPASVFMGDTGSLALGGFAACAGVFTGNTLYIALIGFPFVCSVLSVLIQVIYFKATGGKRVFLMSPLHHHFQEKGYSETKISYAYFLITFLLGILSIVALL